MLVHHYTGKFQVVIKHRKTRITMLAELYQVHKDDPFVLNIEDRLSKIRGKKKEVVREPYVGMPVEITHLKGENRRFQVIAVDLVYCIADLAENGKEIPCKLYWH